MPFIACLNNVTNTHASTQTQKTKPAHTHNHGHEPASHTTLSTRPAKERPAASARTSRPNSIKIALHNNTPLEGMHRRKMLASTMQISNNNPTNPLIHQPATSNEERNHEAPHPTPPTTPTNGCTPTKSAHPQGVSGRGVRPDSSGPNSVLDPVPHQREATSTETAGPRPGEGTRPRPASTIPLVRHHHAPVSIRHRSGCVLLRKEVIQPHLPVRLPCYDFVPIASPTFDSSLRKRLGHWLRVLPTFVT